jgi:hypothetical protein
LISRMISGVLRTSFDRFGGIRCGGISQHDVFEHLCVLYKWVQWKIWFTSGCLVRFLKYIFYISRLIWLKLGRGYFHKNLLSNFEFRGSQRSKNHYSGLCYNEPFLSIK